MDFVHDQRAMGKKLRVLTVVDIFSKYSPIVDPRFSYRAEDVVRTLEGVCGQVGYPKTIRVDQGSEFVSRYLDHWAYANGVNLHFSRTGRPTAFTAHAGTQANPELILKLDNSWKLIKMAMTRIIVTLLLRETGFVKSRQFKDHVYVGDCFNTLRLFNEKEADELLIVDIQAGVGERSIRFDFLRELAGECFMPVGYGGGIRELEDIRRLFYAGFEKVSINTQMWRDPTLIPKAVAEFGSQSLIASIDVRRNLWGKYEVFIEGGRKGTGIDPITAARRAYDMGAGEIILTVIDREGSMRGYDLDLIRKVSDSVSIPVIASGGAGSLDDFRNAIIEGHASAVAAGSFFVLTGKHRAVLVTYPSRDIVFDQV